MTQEVVISCQDYNPVPWHYNSIHSIIIQSMVLQPSPQYYNSIYCIATRISHMVIQPWHCNPSQYYNSLLVLQFDPGIAAAAELVQL